MNKTKDYQNNLLNIVMDMFLEPTKIISPYSGQAVYPTINQFTQDGKTYEQAVYNDPITGSFIKRGMVSVKDAKTGEVLQDYKNNQINSLKSVSYRS